MGVVGYVGYRLWGLLWVARVVVGYKNSGLWELWLRGLSWAVGLLSAAGAVGYGNCGWQSLCN